MGGWVQSVVFPHQYPPRFSPFRRNGSEYTSILRSILYTTYIVYVVVYEYTSYRLLLWSKRGVVVLVRLFRVEATFPFLNRGPFIRVLPKSLYMSYDKVVLFSMNLERSAKFSKFKKETNLPSFREVTDLSEAGLAGAVEARLKLMERYATVNEALYRTIRANGWRVADAIRNMVDLQGKLWEFEEKLKEQGLNPLESPEWMKARELLSKEAQFIQKQGLEVAKFDESISRRKEAFGDDAIFEVVRDDA